jgi:hypothetical protein
MPAATPEARAARSANRTRAHPGSAETTPEPLDDPGADGVCHPQHVVGGAVVVADVGREIRPPVGRLTAARRASARAPCMDSGAAPARVSCSESPAAGSPPPKAPALSLGGPRHPTAGPHPARQLPAAQPPRLPYSAPRLTPERGRGHGHARPGTQTRPRPHVCSGSHEEPQEHLGRRWTSPQRLDASNVVASAAGHSVATT